MSQLAYHRILEKLKQQELQNVKSCINKVISSSETIEKSIKDFPKIDLYFRKYFSKIDLSDIRIYLTAPRVMDRNGFEECGGCYIDYFKIILVKNRIVNKLSGRELFQKELNKLVVSSVDPDDVVVHELMHAVSHIVRSGAGTQFRNAEEEFVYTNCIDFYHSRGAADKDIVQGILLPFFLLDVLTDREVMLKFWGELNVILPDENDYAKLEFQKKMQRLFNKHALFLATSIVNVAKERAFRMIDLYNKYGRQQVHTNVAPDEDPALRMDTIDMDCYF